MSRTSTIGARRPAKVPIEKYIETIVADVFETFAMPSEEWRSLWKSPLVPMAITTVDHRELRCTQVAIDAAHELTELVWKDRAEVRQSISREAFKKISFNAIGEAIVASPSNVPPGTADGPVDDEFFSAVSRDYLDWVDRLAGKKLETTSRHIPCHLFQFESEVPAFNVGPVMFRPRAAWISTFVTEPAVSELVRKVEQRIVTMEELSRADLSDITASTARSILNFLGGYGWIATVEIEDHEMVQSHRKASIIVGLAIDVIGLTFDSENANRLTQAGRKYIFGEVRMATNAHGKLVQGMSSNLPGIGGRPEALRAKMAAEQPFFDQAGSLLEAYLEARKTGAAVHLIERWVNALYWFGEARREASDFMAVVDYGCAADVLSGAGGKIGPLKEFADAALNPKGSPHPEPQVISDAANRVYVEGRNKLAHGEVSGLFEDLENTRKIGDALMAAIFLEVTPELAKVLQDRPHYQKLSVDHAYQGFTTLLKQRL